VTARVRKRQILRGEKAADGFFSSRVGEANSAKMKNARVGKSGRMEKNILGKTGGKTEWDRNKSFAAAAMGMRCFRRHIGQGATEYLVLLAVVLIVALVSVALLGFFPGMASDAQMTQSKAYWSSAQPIAIIESAARTDGVTYPYLRLRNNGAYPIRITGIVGADGGKATQFEADSTCGQSAFGNFSDYFYLAPGEEKYLAVSSWYGTACSRYVSSALGGTSSGMSVAGASSVCQYSAASPGVLDYKTFGFEYIVYLDNSQQITKRQVGKDFIVKCLPGWGL